MMQKFIHHINDILIDKICPGHVDHHIGIRLERIRVFLLRLVYLKMKYPYGISQAICFHH